MSSTRIHKPVRTYAHNLSERRSGSAEMPYGSYKYESSKNYMPGGLFHFVKNCDYYVPTLHGMSSGAIRNLKEVAVCATASSLGYRPFLNSPHLYEVELINTGFESLKQGDRFAVQLPNREDVDAQTNVVPDPGYDPSVNSAIWGGLLATRRINCDLGGDPIEEVVQAIKREPEFDVFRLISPYSPQSTLSMLMLLSNGGNYDTVDDVVRTAAAGAVNGEFDSAAIGTLLESGEAKQYLRTVLEHALTIVESVQGFAGGQVVRSCNGYNTSTIKTGERFMAQININRWLM